MSRPGAEVPLPHGDRIGVLLVNLGSPDAPTPAAVRRYLREFLWDPRVVEIPRPIWWLILHLFVLRARPAKSAKAYREIWREDGSPLVTVTRKLGDILRDRLNLATDQTIHVEVAMRYGAPSMGAALENMRRAAVSRIVILPLYPQYAAATTASVFDALVSTVLGWRYLPGLCFVSDYHRHRAYIDAVAESMEHFWVRNGKPEYLLFSFHGLPEKSRALGDPYFDQCHRTAAAVAKKLHLDKNAWQVVFQSRFGRAQWLKPYCVDTLNNLPGRGICNVDVACPGFPVDCLETLEEIAITNKKVFLNAGGHQYRYIPALNTRESHIQLLTELVLEHVKKTDGAHTL